jgi:hypothetical protein
VSPPGDEIEVVDAGGTRQATGIYECSPTESPLQQGEVLAVVVHQFLDVDRLRESDLVINETRHSFVIVASQSCDLEWDHDARRRGGEPDKLLPHIMLCEAFRAQEVKDRKNLKGEVINNSTLWSPIKKNKDERYHFFQAVPAYEDAAGEGLPELVVDFKRYFSMPTAELYWKLTQEAKRRTRLRAPYLEHFATRLFQYQARVATPTPHSSQ